MPELLIGKVDLNDKAVAESLLANLKSISTTETFYFDLYVKNGSCFEAPRIKTNVGPGWYIIINGRNSLYVGRSDDLYCRLNTPNGSRDNFNNTRRTFENERNFVKKYSDIGLISNLRVLIITELQLKFKKLSDLDRKNIEKFISVFRNDLEYMIC